MEAAVHAQWQRRYTAMGPPRPCFPAEVDHERLTHQVAQSVVVVLEMRSRPAFLALLQRANLEARGCELPGQNRGGPARPDHHDINMIILCAHIHLPRWVSLFDCDCANHLWMDSACIDVLAGY